MIDRERLRKDIHQKLRTCDLFGIMDIYMTPEVGLDGWPQVYITFPPDMNALQRLSYAQALGRCFHTFVGYRNGGIELVSIEYTSFCHPHLELLNYDDSKQGESTDEGTIRQMIEQAHELRVAQKKGGK